MRRDVAMQKGFPILGVFRLNFLHFTNKTNLFLY
ncbi:unnamed protein product [Musa acuminata subsp. malaccensis]|uniref:(wild Malaysian banana) hypothetical protein n=1 Tax=Musa acuminata subsp. malaccensis TaxID=214687 RepID=A0A8D7AFN5_MUSAM|nr:unnamed protein product [Musa acuminata subsp. malaccensis]